MVGFETFNPISNLGGIYVLIMIYFARLVLLLILGGIKHFWRVREAWILKKFVKFLEYLTNNLIFESIILILNGSIIQTTMTVLLFMYSPSNDTSMFTFKEMTHLHSSIAGYFCLIFGLLAVPSLFACLIFLKPDSILDIKLRKIIGGLLENVKKGNKLNIVYNLVFVARRILLCFVGFFLKEYSA